MRKLGYLLGAVCWLACQATVAHAQTASPRLGDQGTWLLGGNAGLAWSSNTARSPDEETSSLNLWLEPSAAYFIARNIALGGALRGSRDQLRTPDYERTDYALGASVFSIFHAALGGELSLLPRLAIGLAYVDRDLVPSTRSFTGLSGTGINYRRWAFLPYRNLFSSGNYIRLDVELFVPLVMVPVAGFYCGIGPYVNWAYAIGGDFFQPVADDWLLSFGVSTVLGSWL